MYCGKKLPKGTAYEGVCNKCAGVKRTPEGGIKFAR